MSKTNARKRSLSDDKFAKTVAIVTAGPEVRLSAEIVRENEQSHQDVALQVKFGSILLDMATRAFNLPMRPPALPIQSEFMPLESVLREAAKRTDQRRKQNRHSLSK